MSKLAKKICQYVRSQPAAYGLARFMDGFWDTLPTSAIFGGLIRDFGLSVDSRLRSDIDIVTVASRRQILDALRGHEVSQNKFGGYRLYVGGRMFDIWSLDDTWAVREGLVPANRLTDLCKTTFFNLDVGLLDFGRGKLLTPDYDAGFESALTRRYLDINLYENPNPSGMADRAVRMAIEKHVTFSPRLCDFVLRESNRSVSTPLLDRFFSKLSKHMNERSGEEFRYWDQLSLWPDTNFPHSSALDHCRSSVS